MEQKPAKHNICFGGYDTAIYSTSNKPVYNNYVRNDCKNNHIL